MYAGQFGYTDTAGGASFNGAPHPRNPHMQPGLSQNLHQHQHHHQPRQQHQQIMYNAQQYPITSQAGTFSSGPSPAMLGGPGPAGAMRNAAMPHLAANNQMAFQTPYTTSPYGGNIPSPVAPQQQPQMPPNFMMTGSMPQYQMSAGQMQPQQQMMQRMHPSQQNAASMSPQLQYNNPQGTPTSMSTQQFPSTQAGGMAQGQTASNGMQSLPSATTPQTPTFPPVGHPSQVNGVSIATSPLSPASESREKERFGIILEINQELLLDSLQMQNTRAELKKELATEWSADKKAECEEQDKLAQVDYQQCMRRLQGNLSYMASLADKKSKAMDHDSLVTVRLSEPPNLAVNTDAASNALPSWKSLHGRDLTPTDTMADVAQEETDEEEDEDAITPQPTVLEYGQDLHDDLAMEPNEVDEYGEEQQAPPNHGLHTARNSAAHSSSTRQSVESEAVDWDRLQETEEAELKDQDTDHAGNTALLLARLEQENNRLATDAKSVKMVNGPTPAALRYSMLPPPPMTDLEFYMALVKDYQQTAARLPTLLSNKIRKGIPPPLRGVVWQSMAGSRDTALEEAFDRLCGESSPYDGIIGKDLGRSFPGVDMFMNPDGDGQRMLGRVLKCFSLYDTKIGYCQGLAFLVGPLLMHMPDKQAFCVLVKLMEAYDLRLCFVPDLSGLHVRIYQFGELLRQHLPTLSAHLAHLQVDPAYVSQWFLSFFAVTCPLPMLFRIYDVVFAEGASETIMRVALSLMRKNEARIMACPEMDDVMQLLLSRGLWDCYHYNADDFVDDFVTTSISRNSSEDPSRESAPGYGSPSPKYAATTASSTTNSGRGSKDDNKYLHNQIEDLLTALSELQRNSVLLSTQLQREREERDEDKKAVRSLLDSLRAKASTERATSPRNTATDNERSLPTAERLSELLDVVETRFREDPNSRRSSVPQTKNQLRDELARANEQFANEVAKTQHCNRRLQEMEQEVTSIKEQLRESHAHVRNLHQDKQRLEKQVHTMRVRASDTSAPVSAPVSETANCLGVAASRESVIGMPPLPAPVSEDDALLLELAQAKTAEAIARQEADEAIQKLESLRKAFGLGPGDVPPSAPPSVGAPLAAATAASNVASSAASAAMGMLGRLTGSLVPHAAPEAKISELIGAIVTCFSMRGGAHITSQQTAQLLAMAENGKSAVDQLKTNASAAYDTVANGPVAQNVKDQHAKTSAEFSNLAAARQTPNNPAATGQPLTHYHSFFSELLSWNNPRASGIAYASLVSLIFAVRYLDVLRWGLKLTWMTLGITIAAEVSGKLLLNSGFATQLRPRKYYTLPRETLDALIGDVHELANFFVIETQRIVFVENIGVSVMAALGALSSFFLAKIVPYWGLALIATTVLFAVPLVYRTNQELIDHLLEQASDVVQAQTSQLRNVAQKHTEQATQITKQYMGDYTAKAQAMIRGNKVEDVAANVHESDFPAAPQQDFKQHEEPLEHDLW
ncbi:hypothetical protein P8C59_006697 [Phyllachora maydis]|uniref:Reticulon-like protein n=1 Tax=Phyllachora maydis TaxID=1825666 RepID=A0AAD9I6Z7_9PEZI|nr:hypothetical protein P8C59_006697 [Phyllachora maydis]